LRFTSRIVEGNFKTWALYLRSPLCTSPSASANVLPCSKVIDWAISFYKIIIIRLKTQQVLKTTRIWFIPHCTYNKQVLNLTMLLLISAWYANNICCRERTDVWDHVSKAFDAELTAAFISSWVALGQKLITSLVALIKKSQKNKQEVHNNSHVWLTKVAPEIFYRFLTYRVVDRQPVFSFGINKLSINEKLCGRLQRNWNMLRYTQDGNMFKSTDQLICYVKLTVAPLLKSLADNRS
jgi:hypothetical protein